MQVQSNVRLLRKMLSQVKPTANGCLEWTGFRIDTGYGQAYNGKRSESAHRVMYRLTKGEIPKGMQVLHSCDNPPCVSPIHLSLGTAQENMRQSVERGRHHEATRTQCVRGHDLADAYINKDGSRHCRLCQRARQRMAVGWPEDLAYSAPKKQGHLPKGFVRVMPKPTRKKQSAYCTKGHELVGRNRYVTPKGHAECRKCRQIARDRFGRNRASQFSGGVDA